MSSLIIISAGMHKIANVEVEVKYCRQGNVITYIPIIFEIFRDGINFFAVPMTSHENIELTNLPKEFSFRFKKEIMGISVPDLEEVVEEIVKKLQPLGLIKVPKKYSEMKKVNMSGL